MIVWVDSPLGCLVAHSLLDESILRSQAEVGTQVGDQLWSLVGDRVLGQIWHRTEDRFADRIRAHFGDSVCGLVEDKVWDSAMMRRETRAWERVWDRLWNRVGDRGRAEILVQAWAEVAGQVWDRVWDGVGAPIKSRVEGQLKDQIGTDARVQMGHPVRAQIWDQVQNQAQRQVSDQVDFHLLDQILPGLDGQFWPPSLHEMDAPVWNHLRLQVRDQIKAQSASQIKDFMSPLIGAQVWDQVGDRVLDQVGDRIWTQVAGLFQNVCFDQGETDRLAAYEFLLRECGLTVCEKLIPFMHIAEHCGWWLPYSQVVIVSERPLRLHRNTDGRLHCDGGPTVLCRDGWAAWFLNGVRVPQQIAETPGDQLNPQLVLTERNAEMRREIARKVGIERLCESLEATVIDARGDYELLQLNLWDGRRRPYLKMKNPSIGVCHIEGVSPDCRTVQEALMWRNGTDERPVVLT